MQTVLQVICSGGKSLRDEIENDPHLVSYELKVHSQHKRGRNPGWAKLRATKSHHRGSVNVEWHVNTATLVCRVINKGTARPTHVVGNLMKYLFENHGGRVKAIIVLASRPPHPVHKTRRR